MPHPARGGLAAEIMNNPGMKRVHAWVLRHDDSKPFVIAYIGLAVILTIWLGLFWLLVVVGTHAVLEGIKQQHANPGWIGTLVRSVWELKLDLALILFAFVVTLYMDAIVGMAGLGAASRVGLQGGSRFAAWQRVLRGALLSVDDAAQVGRAVIAGKAKHSKSDEEVTEAPEITRWGGWSHPWSWGDRFSLGLAAGCILLLLVSPWLTGSAAHEVVGKVLSELRPFPS